MDEAEDADLLCVASASSFVEYLGSLDDHCEVLKRLLMEKNAEGFTPFMAAIACKVNGHHALTCTCTLNAFCVTLRDVCLQEKDIL